MLKISLSINLATGDTAYVESDNMQEVHNVLGYLQSIGALRTNPQLSPAADFGGADTAGETGGGVEGKAPADTQAGKAGDTAGKAPRQSRKKGSAGAAAQPAATEQTGQADTAPGTDDAEPPKAKPEDVTAAVTTLANNTSLQVARGVLEEFGVKRAAELKPAQYDAFVAACLKAEASAL